MKLPRVRFTVRRTMVAVAVVGASLGAWRCVREMDQRSAFARGEARRHRYEARVWARDYRIDLEAWVSFPRLICWRNQCGYTLTQIYRYGGLGSLMNEV